jgi:hypothetical protein
MRLPPRLEPALATHVVRLLARGVAEDDELEEGTAEALVDWLTVQAQQGLPVPAWCDLALCAGEVAMLWQAFGLTWEAQRYEAMVRKAEQLRSVQPMTSLHERCLRVVEEALLPDSATRTSYMELRALGLGRFEAACVLRA